MIYTVVVTLAMIWLVTKVIGLLRALIRFARPLSKEELDAYDGVVMITGGAAGIGLATAEFMAHRGRDLFLIDYDAKQLAAAKDRLEQLCPHVTVTTEQMDLTTLIDPYTYHKFKRRVDAMKIGICFNNAGIGEKNVNQFLLNSHEHLTKYLLYLFYA